MGQLPYHSGYNLILKGIKNNCTCLTVLVFTHLKRRADTIKYLDLENKSPSRWKLHSFSVTFKMYVFRKVFSRNQGSSYQKEKENEKKREAILKTRPMKNL